MYLGDNYHLCNDANNRISHQEFTKQVCAGEVFMHKIAIDDQKAHEANSYTVPIERVVEGGLMIDDLAIEEANHLNGANIELACQHPEAGEVA